MPQSNSAETAIIGTIPVEINGRTVYMPRTEAAFVPLASFVCWMFDHPQEALHIGRHVVRVVALAGVVGASLYLAFDGSRHSQPDRALRHKAWR